jgi:tryptophan synthase alpha chain
MVDRASATRLPGIVRSLREAGASALELGFPFSEPIADGPVLQSACERALAHGTRWSDLRHALRQCAPILPTAVMTYANPLLHRGLGQSLRDLRAAGCSGLLVADLPLEESPPWARAARGAGLSLIQFASPATDVVRAARIARSSGAFTYLVGGYGVTGAVAPGRRTPLTALIRAMHVGAPERPVLVGFGVRNAGDARRMRSMGADGVVVGSAI